MFFIERSIIIGLVVTFSTHANQSSGPSRGQACDWQRAHRCAQEPVDGLTNPVSRGGGPHYDRPRHSRHERRSSPTATSSRGRSALTLVNKPTDLCPHDGLRPYPFHRAIPALEAEGPPRLVVRHGWLRQPRLEPKLFDPDLIFVAVEMIVIALGIVTAAWLANPPNK